MPGMLEHHRGRPLFGASPAAIAPLTFEQFIRQVAPSFEFYPHVQPLVGALQQLVDGTLGRLLVSMPPRHGKSLLCSRLLPAYYLYRHPERWVSLASYGSDLAYQHSREARAYFGASGQALAADSRAVGTWQTPQRGGCWATGAGGSQTGKGFSLGCVDDPVKSHAEALSTARQDAIWEWWRATYRTRCEPGGAIVVIMTRWAESDLVARLLEHERSSSSPERWTVIDYPAIRPESDEDDTASYYPATCTVIPDSRPAGAALCPARFPLDVLQQLRESVGSFWWSALYQGRPVPAEGGLFKRDWFRFGTPPERFDVVVAAWDLAFKNTPGSDFCAGVVVGRSGPDFWILEVVRQRLDAPGAIAAIQSQRSRWPTIGAILVEDAANGAAVLQTLRRRLPGLKAVRPDGGKVARASAIAPYAESGNVWIPEDAPWAEVLLQELAAFPAAPHDDQTDALTYAITHLARCGRFTVTHGAAIYDRGPAAAAPLPMPATELDFSSPGAPVIRH